MSGPYKWDTKVIFLTPEVTRGTAAAVAAAHALVTMNGAVTPMDGGETELPLDGRQAAAREAYTTNLHQSLSFETPLCPPAAAGTAPHWGTAARALSLDETIVATTRVEYTPTLVQADQESFTARYYHDGQRRQLAGFQAGGSLMFTNGEIPRLMVQGKGAYAAGTDATSPHATPDVSSYRQPAVVSFENTPTVSLAGVPIMLESLQVELGNAAVFENRPNYRQASVDTFNPTGTLSFLLPSVATLNLEGMLDSKVAFSLIHYTAAGTRVGFSAAAMQVGRISYQAIGEKVGVSVPVRFTRPAAGGPAFTLWSGTAPT